MALSRRMESGILVDSSVFIDYLRTSQPKDTGLVKVLAKQRAVLSPYVRLELLMGVRAIERQQLGSLLEALPLAKFEMSHFQAAEGLLGLVRKSGINFGLIDYLIVLQALALQIPLFTHDRVMKQVAKVLQVELFDSRSQK